MAFNLINRSPNNIILVPAFPTRRTSIDVFLTSNDAVLRFVEDLAENAQNAQQPAPVVTRQLFRHLNNVRFAFDRLHQQRQARRFPINLRQVWAYVGLPLQQVSDDLAVSVSVLRSRVREAGFPWPASSDAERLLLAVQYSTLNNMVGRRMIRSPRGLSFAGVQTSIRTWFGIGNQVITELHVHIRGGRFGPIVTQAQWLEVVAHEYNVHRISLLLVRV